MKIVIILIILLLLFPIHSYADVQEREIILEKAEIDQYGLGYISNEFINMEKLNGLMVDLEKKVYQDPTNAKIDENGKFIQEQSGVTLDRDKFEYSFRSIFYSNKQQKLTIPKRPIHPRVDEALLKEISNHKLGSYSTQFKTSNQERSNNIELAAEAINNTVIFPGEQFSFNEVVGERTKEKGYQQAPVIVKGELAEDIGGGICQVSSTLFNAVDLKGIQIIERYAHSKEVPYVPPGRDATVSWWGPDFVFKNMYNEPVLIRAQANSGSMNVAIYSSESAEYFKGENDQS